MGQLLKLAINKLSAGLYQILHFSFLAPTHLPFSRSLYF